MVGWLLLLPLLLLSSLQQVQLQTTTTTTTNTTDAAELNVTAVSSTLSPITTFMPDPELSHTLEELIEESNNNSNIFCEGTVTRKNETTCTNATISSTEKPVANVENASSITTSTSQPQVDVSTTQPPLTIATTEEVEVVVVTLTDRANDTQAPTTAGSQPTKYVDDNLITTTENTPKPPDILPVTIPVTTTEPTTTRVSSSLPPPLVSSPSPSTSSPVKRPRPPAWVNKIARPIVFPLFLAISWLFLGFLLVCHILVPKLRENTGTVFMGYIVALMLKATVTFCNIVFKHLHSPGFCFYAAAISYLKSLAMLFWVNIMVFDIWRKSRSLVQFKPSRPVPMWKYHLYGWGTPISLSLLSLLIELLVPDEASWIIKPGFDNGYKCWFEDSEAQLLYLNTPVGILHISNVIMMVLTYRYVIRITDNAFIDDDQGAPGNTLPRDTAVPAAKRSDFVSDFWFQFWILTYTVAQWVLWMIAQILQHFTGAWQLKVVPGFLIALQGVFLFIIFISNNGKRNRLKQHVPEIFERITDCWSQVHKSQNRLEISKSNAASANATAEPQTVAGQTNPAYVEDENNAVSYIALANINQNQ